MDGTYDNLLDAQNACIQEKDCKMFYDIKSENNSFVLCGSPYLLKRSDFLSSRLFTKCKTFHLRGVTKNIR